MPFFFPAEGGIRDLYVTGVRTCALRIFFAAGTLGFGGSDRVVGAAEAEGSGGEDLRARRRLVVGHLADRSEEPRVGKECTAHRPRAAANGDTAAAGRAAADRRSHRLAAT